MHREAAILRRCRRGRHDLGRTQGAAVRRSHQAGISRVLHAIDDARLSVVAIGDGGLALDVDALLVVVRTG